MLLTCKLKHHTTAITTVLHLFHVDHNQWNYLTDVKLKALVAITDLREQGAGNSGFKLKLETVESTYFSNVDEGKSKP